MESIPSSGDLVVGTGEWIIRYTVHVYALPILYLLQCTNFQSHSRVRLIIPVALQILTSLSITLLVLKAIKTIVQSPFHCYLSEIVKVRLNKYSVYNSANHVSLVLETPELNFC